MLRRVSGMTRATRAHERCLSRNGKAGSDEQEVEANRRPHLGRGSDGALGGRPTLRMDRWAAPTTRAGDSVICWIGQQDDYPFQLSIVPGSQGWWNHEGLRAKGLRDRR